MKINIDIPNHPYQVIIEEGIFEKAGPWVAELWQRQKIVIISDETVAALYASSLMSNLETAGFDISLFTFPAGEASKNLSTAAAAWDFCAAQGLTRSDGIIGLGGGVTGDLAAFVASTYQRGIHFLQIASSLTAQVDSSVGGKTGINTAYAKNMIGTFSQPDGILIDPKLLYSLDERCLREGLGEVIKCALIADPLLWEQLVELSTSRESILKAVTFLIAHAIEVKRGAVIGDETDQAGRLLLNFGHTIGHALETTAGYGQLMHGEAVGLGMLQITRVAEKTNQARLGLSDEIEQMLAKFDLPTDYEPWDEEALFECLSHDKKARGDKLKLILVTEIGHAEIQLIKIEEMKTFLNKEK